MNNALFNTTTSTGRAKPLIHCLTWILVDPARRVHGKFFRLYRVFIAWPRLEPLRGTCGPLGEDADIRQKPCPRTGPISGRFDKNYPHYRGTFARVIDFRVEYAQSLTDDFD